MDIELFSGQQNFESIRQHHRKFTTQLISLSRRLALRLDFPEEPGAGVGPVVVRGAGGNAQDFGGFLQSHADEITQLHQFSFDFALSSQFVERLVHGEEFVFVTRPGNFNAFKFHALVVATVTHGAFAAGLVNEDAAHGLGGGGEEMSAIGKLRIIISNQAQPSFMNELRGRLQGLVGRFIRHACRRQLAQLAINQRQQFIGGLGVAVFDGLKDECDVTQQQKPLSGSSLLREKISPYGV